MIGEAYFYFDFSNSSLNNIDIYIFKCIFYLTTALCRGRKTKLQTLAREFLGIRIQESKHGHDSIEDAIASMKLTQLKLANSVDFGDAILLGQRKFEEVQYEAQSNKISEQKLSEKANMRKYGTSIFSHVTKDKKTAAIIGCDGVMNEYAQYLKSSSLSIMNDNDFDKDDQVIIYLKFNVKITLNIGYCRVKKKRNYHFKKYYWEKCKI